MEPWMESFLHKDRSIPFLVDSCYYCIGNTLDRVRNIEGHKFEPHLHKCQRQVHSLFASFITDQIGIRYSLSDRRTTRLVYPRCIYVKRSSVRQCKGMI